MSSNWITSINDSAAIWAPIIWRASWQGGLFILAVWLICKLFRTMPAAAKSWLWWIASLQLLIRFAMISSLNLPILPAHQAPVHAEFSAQQAPSLQASAFEIPISTTETQRSAPKEAPLFTSQSAEVTPVVLSEHPSVHLSANAIGLGLWLLGFAACIGISIKRLLAARKLVRNATPLVSGPAFDLAQEFSIDYGIPIPRVLASEDALCPLLASWRRPAIVLPAASIADFDYSQMRMAIAHEFAHLKRRDLWFGIVPAATQSLFFFHPLAWLATHEGAAAREAACDTEALRISGGSPTAYARLLIDSAQSHSSMAVLGTAFGYRLIQRRISMLKSVAGTNARRYRTACTALIALGAVCALPWSVTAQSVALPKPAVKKTVKKAAKPHRVAQKRHLARRALLRMIAPPPAMGIRAPTAGPGMPPPMAVAPRGLVGPPTALAGVAPMALQITPPTAIGIPGGITPPPTISAPRPPTPARLGSLSAVRLRQRGAAGTPPVLGDIPIVGKLFQAPPRPGAPSSGGFGGLGHPLGELTPPAPLATSGGLGGGQGLTLPAVPGAGRSEVSMNGDFVNVRFEHVDIHTAIRQLFDATETSYMIKSDVASDKVTCTLRNVTREQALQTILNAVNQPLSFRVEAGVTTIFTKL